MKFSISRQVIEKLREKHRGSQAEVVESIIRWRHYGDHEVAPLCRSSNGAIGAVADM